MANVLPLFQFPTTVIWIDDDETFLKTIKATVKSVNLNKMFISSKEFLLFFQDYISPLLQHSFLRGEHGNENYDLLDHRPVDFNVTDIAKLRNYAKRIDEISLIVCDHKLPEITGIELFTKIKDCAGRKILLTGEAQDRDVITAFNEGIINRYISKDNLELSNKLSSYSSELIRQYFCNLTSNLLSVLEVDGDLSLSDLVFVNFFNDWCEKNEIKEFYLIDKQGSFLAINNSEEEYFFVLHTDRSLEEFTEIYSANLTLELKDAIQRREKIPFFGYGKDAWHFEVNKWSDYFYEADVLQGREKYYFAIIKKSCSCF